MNNQLFWIGIQESEIKDTSNLFLGSITFFGSNRYGNFALDKKYNARFDYNKDLEVWFEFVNQTAEKIIRQYPDALFVLYYPMDAVYYSEPLTSHLVGYLGSRELDLWDNKFRCREWLGNEVPVLQHEVYYGQQILDKRSSLSINNYVLQGAYSCGGSETWLLTKQNWESVACRINTDKLYSLTPYIENNISINIHLVIYAQKVLLFPGSIQIIKLNQNSYNFEYKGADFITFRYLPDSIKEKTFHYSKIIGERLRKSGYLGICGIDFITTPKDVFFSEINPRFQSSTFLINKSMSQVDDSYSMQKYHIDAFYYPRPKHISNFEVNFSYYKVTYSKKNVYLAKHLFQQASCFKPVQLIDDNLSWKDNLEDGTYLYKLLFQKNISAISHDYRLIIHPNLSTEDSLIGNEACIDILKLKIMLLSHGIIIDYDALSFLNNSNGINYKEFDAIDLVIEQEYYISVPYQTNLSQMSPFIIKLRGEKLYLYYGSRVIAEIQVRGIDLISGRKTSDGLMEFSDFTYLGNDRLRVFHRLGCYYKNKGIGCGFCDIDRDERILSFENITEAIDAYDSCNCIKHYLIGGGSNSIENNYAHVIRLAEYIRRKNGNPINLMSLPIVDKQILARLKEAGVTEVTFNVEIFNRQLARKYMPGKGLIPIETYFSAFKNAVEIWGTSGNVRSMFIVGLESEKSLLSGVEEVCKIGVSPILSLFKPIAGTPLDFLLPPPDTDLLKIVCAAQSICKKYGVKMGPSCHYCEDNTLKISESPKTSQ